MIGFISLDEFAEACELLQKHLPEHNTKEQLMDMCKLMDINKDGLVDLNEFLETFRLCEQAKSNAGNKNENEEIFYLFFPFQLSLFSSI